MSHSVSFYKMESQNKDVKAHPLHHDQTPYEQKIFLLRVHKLPYVLKDMGNPFKEDFFYDLLLIDTKDEAQPKYIELVYLQSLREG